MKSNKDTGKLLKIQDDIFRIMFKALPENCLLTGGTALTRFHGFTHRFSEDIDLFFYLPEGEKQKDTLNNITSWLTPLRDNNFKITLLGVTEDNSLGMNRKLFHSAFIISKKRVIVRVDFVEDVFSGCWAPSVLKTVDTGINFRVDDLEAILHKKLFAVYSSYMMEKPIRSKDLVDLYMLFNNSFDLDKTRAFYEEGSGVSLPFDTIMDILTDIKNLAGDEILGINPGIPAKTLKWLGSLKSGYDGKKD